LTSFKLEAAFVKSFLSVAFIDTARGVILNAQLLLLIFIASYYSPINTSLKSNRKCNWW